MLVSIFEFKPFSSGGLYQFQILSAMGSENPELARTLFNERSEGALCFLSFCRCSIPSLSRSQK